MPNEVKLLPCPFCGGKAKLLQDGYYEPANLEKYPERTRSWVVCPCDTHWKRNTAAEAIAAWNTRATTRPTIVTDEVVERVARAICWAFSEEDEECQIQCLNARKCMATEVQDCFKRDARAALAAMPAIVGGE